MRIPETPDEKENRVEKKNDASRKERAYENSGCGSFLHCIVCDRDYDTPMTMENWKTYRLRQGR